MFEHFKAPSKGSLGARLIQIKQDGCSTNSVKKFLSYFAPLPEMAESVLIDAFATGLEPTPQAEVKSCHRVTLEDCMREAQLVSDRDLAIKLALSEWGDRGPGTTKAQTQNVKNGTLSIEKREGKRNKYTMKQYQFQ